MRFTPIAYTERALDEYAELFAQCFPGTSHFTRAYLAWLYAANPDGNALGFDAWADDGTLAAHYVCIPAKARVEGQEVSVLLSLNTATRPQFQGKGLFTKLAALTFEAGAATGYDGVYGVANANSTPGFIRKLGFQLVRPLEAMVGVGKLGTGPIPANLSFERMWSDSALAWRCSSPINRIQCRARGTVWQFHARALTMVPAYAELDRGIGLQAVDSGAPLTPLRLFLGLVPDQARGLATYASIPVRMRPSPLNLIYRSFSPRVTELDPALIRFSFLDFDAY